MLAAALLLLMFILPAYAAEEGIENGIAGELGTSGETDYYRNLYGLSGETDSDKLLDIPNVTVEDLGARLVEKGGDFVYLLKIAGRYVCLGTFVICCIMIVIGIIGNQRRDSLPGSPSAGIRYHWSNYLRCNLCGHHMRRANRSVHCGLGYFLSISKWICRWKIGY